MQIFITGMGLVTPAGTGITPLWDRCLKKETYIEEGLGAISSSKLTELWNDISQSPWIKKEPEYFSKSLVLSLHSIIQAIDSASWESFTKTDLIIIGTTTGQIGLWEKELTELLNIDSKKSPDQRKLAKQPLQTLAESLKAILNFPGKILITASACSAATQAIVLAEQYLTSGRASRVIAGGVEELSDLTITGFSCLKLLSLNPCMPFEQTRVGINLSEGSGFYTFEKTSNAKALGILYAGETVLDSYHMTSPSTEGTGLQKAMRLTLEKNNLSPKDISMIHAHGTGSIHNDQAEAFALNALFSHSPPVISTKGVHGHALGASGAIELGICLQILKTQIIPPITGLTTIDETIKINLPREVLETPIKYLMKTTLGFGGVNSTFILRSVLDA
jgi:3-oxoacyl-[acyl-carrier-protein] synthase II